MRQQKDKTTKQQAALITQKQHTRTKHPSPPTIFWSRRLILLPFVMRPPLSPAPRAGTQHADVAIAVCLYCFHPPQSLPPLAPPIIIHTCSHPLRPSLRYIPHTTLACTTSTTTEPLSPSSSIYQPPSPFLLSIQPQSKNPDRQTYTRQCMQTGAGLSRLSLVEEAHHDGHVVEPRLRQRLLHDVVQAYTCG